MKKLTIMQTKDQVAAIIKNDILSGILTSSDTLTQEQVAEKTGLSRMPVREAFQALEQDGFLVRLPNRHVRAVEMSDENMNQYFQLLATIEAFCCLQLIQKEHTALDLEARIQKAIDENTPDAEAALHSAIIDLIHNEYLDSIFQKMLNGFYDYALRHFWEPHQNIDNLNMLREGIHEQDTSKIHQGLEQYFSIFACAMKER